MAAVRAAAAERFAGEALAGVGDAQRAVDEHFELDRRLAADRADFGDREFAGQHHALDAEFLGGADALAAGERHLRRSVDGEVRAHRAQQSNEAEVLHEHGIDAGFGELHDMLFDCFEFGGKDERVERDVAADAALVEKRHDLGQRVEMQIRGPGAGVESAFEAEVDGVGAVFHGGRYAQPIARGGQQLQTATHPAGTTLILAAVFACRRSVRSGHNRGRPNCGMGKN